MARGFHVCADGRGFGEKPQGASCDAVPPCTWKRRCDSPHRRTRSHGYLCTKSTPVAGGSARRQTQGECVGVCSWVRSCGGDDVGEGGERVGGSADRLVGDRVTLTSGSCGHST